jgi:hypothetical protein
METTTSEKTAVMIHRDGVLIALIKRDEKTRKAIVYKVKEAKVDEIADLISTNDIKI